MENMIKRFLSLMLALVLTLSCAPMVAFAEGEVDYVAYNVETAQQYTDVSDAAKAAAEGQTVRLLKDAKDSIVTILEGTTLDLSGFSLEAEYVANFGQLEDNSASNTGCLKVEKGRFMIRGDNTQLPVLTENGYQFVEFIGFKEAWLAEGTKYAFQPTFEPYAHTLLSNGTDNTDLTINVRVSWEQGDGTRYQDFVYSNDHVAAYVASYDAATGKYGKMFTLTIRDAANFSGLTIGSVVASVSGVEKASDGIEIKDSNVTVDENNMVTEDVTVSAGQASAVVPQGTLLEKDTTKLSLTVDEIDESQSNITLGENETQKSVDVHIAGVSADNTVPMAITLKEFAAPGLNEGNLKLYHVEDGVTNEMTRVASVAEFTAHNQFCYDAVTGDVVLYMATFSEVAAVSNDTKAWEGNFDYSWYDADETELTIANADQLAGFGAIVGGMAKDAEGAAIAQDSFDDKTVKLVNDINLGDKESENNPDLIFYPIGYNSDDGKYEKTGVAVSTGFYTFNGTFDGNGHTISNFYQNTWEMKGDNNYYDAKLQYYRDGMGLFGKVYGGTVKNLTVNNFSSDGEFTTTGVIAAYADDATFQNIAITNCNPRVYNIGNGGIVGCVGWYAKDAGLTTTFSNITVDNSNKISALWGSYDVACGGIVGQYYPTSGQSGSPKNAGIRFENCHVSAQMDVYNDVCANYQYYAYRYTGMMIGSIRENETIDGHVYPKMTGITASNCTVNFGDWNDYYYCELVANSLASYTHDHQMSRLDQVQSVDVENKKVTDLDGNTTEIPTSGRYNYVVVTKKDENGQWIHGDGADYATCYHFVDGKVHSHNDYNGDGTDDYETVNGESVLVEDKQLVYREFNQLFTGYGWGVTSKGLTDFDGVETMGITEGKQEESVEKFKTVENAQTSFTTGTTVTIGDLFADANSGVDIDVDNVQVFVSPVGDDSTAGGNYAANTTDWTQGTLTFSGTGAATISITDYNFCKTTTLNVTIEDQEATEKFDIVMNNGDFLHRVGNSGTVALDKLFKAKDGVTIGTVSVTVEAVDSSSASGDYSNNAIQFSNTGVVKVTIKDDDPYCAPTELILEVVDAVNAITATSATANNVVLLNDIGSGFTVSGRYTVYGNGFTLNYTGNGQYSNNGLKQGIITVKENGTLDNLRIVASIYPVALLYYGRNSLGEVAQDYPVSDGDTHYMYQLSAVAASGNATISDCYIYGGRNNIFVNTGDVTVENTVLECGTVANVQIQSNSSHTITFENVTTIQHQVNSTIGDTSKVMLGAGILVGPETNDNPTIALNGAFKQYNWVNADDASAVSNSMAQAIIKGALDATAYNHTVNGKTASNLGIIYMNTYDATVTNNTDLPYKLDTITIKVSGQNISGQAYSLQGATADQICSDNANADKDTVNGYYEPQFKYSGDLGGQYIEKTDDGDEHCYREGDTIHVMFPAGDTKELDLAALVDISKYTGQDLGLNITCKDSSGNAVALTDNKITLSAIEEYTVTYSVTDTLFYDKDGNKLEETVPVMYSWDVTLSVSLKDTAVPNAYFNFVTESQKMGYDIQNLLVTKNVYQYLPFLAGLQIYDYNGQTPYLRFDGDKDFNKVASIELTNKVNDTNYALAVVKLTDGGIIEAKFYARANSSGNSGYTGTIKTNGNTIYFVCDKETSESEGTTTAAYWYVDYYKFTGNNGTPIESAQQTFNSSGSSANKPSGSFGTTINYTVTYDANGGNCGQTTGYATSASAAVTLPTPTRSGYLFAGWHTAASGGERVGGAGETYTPSANITLYAQWGKPSTVTYDANGGSCNTATDSYTSEALILPTPARDGYWFTGWYTAASGGEKIGDAGAAYRPAGNITLYAQWSPVYTVTYNANGGSVTLASVEYVGTALTLPMPTRDGYAFNGWYTAASGGTPVASPYTPTANTTLYAQWKDPVTVTYDANGGSCGAASATFFGTALTLPTPTRTGYNFTGWYTAASGGTKVGDAGASYSPTADITLYAQWKGYTVTYNANQGSVNPSSATYAGTELILPTPTRSGYKFSGWYTAASGGEKIGDADATYTPTADITLYAQWTFSGCVTGDTLVTLADGTKKEVQNVSVGEEILVWNFYTGTYEVVPVSLVQVDGTGTQNVLHLYFEDGTQLKVIGEHGIFDAELNNFIFIDEYDVENYIGHYFIQQDGDSYKQVKLVDYEITTEDTAAYTIMSAYHYNVILEGMLTNTPAHVGENFFNPFEIHEGMKYDEAQVETDIAQYGLYTYEDFDHVLTAEQFELLNLGHFKVSVGKGLVTYEGLIYLIENFINR